MRDLTLTYNILSKKAGRSVSPGEVVDVAVDVIAFHDLTGHHVIEVLEKAGVKRLCGLDKLVVVFDHLVPPPDVRSAELQKRIREFVRKHSVEKFHDYGYGIMHQVILEEVVLPGQVVVGADSHTCTAGALGAFAQGLGASDVALALARGRVWLTVPEAVAFKLSGQLKEFVTGKEVALEMIRRFGLNFFNRRSVEVFVEEPNAMPIDYRATLANMGIEMNADALIVVPDALTLSFIEKTRGWTPPLPEFSLDGYSEKVEIELSKVEFLIAAPPTIDNVKNVEEVEGLEVDYVFLGSCTNGRLSDLEIAARLLKGKKVKTRCIVIPASKRIFLEALRKGYIEVLTEAGCIVTHSTCGPCLGGHFGIAGPKEVVVSTSNRNFTGRMGSPEAKVYVAGPAVAAVSAAEGRISSPR
ncbi:MAG: 3-isopropylmalate dehydratase large subunit [Acidilobaceae archaeon]